MAPELPPPASSNVVPPELPPPELDPDAASLDGVGIPLRASEEEDEEQSAIVNATPTALAAKNAERDACETDEIPLFMVRPRSTCGR
jgi:hypothetical protein